MVVGLTADAYTLELGLWLISRQHMIHIPAETVLAKENRLHQPSESFWQSFIFRIAIDNVAAS